MAKESIGSFHLTFTGGIPDFKQLEYITKLGFIISSINPLKVENGVTSTKQLRKLCDSFKEYEDSIIIGQKEGEKDTVVKSTHHQSHAVSISSESALDQAQCSRKNISDEGKQCCRSTTKVHQIRDSSSEKMDLTPGQTGRFNPHVENEIVGRDISHMKSDNSMGARPKESLSSSVDSQVFFSDDKKVKIIVREADITKLNVECIVNAANKYLRHGGGVAKAICKAAGTSLQTECTDFINAKNTLQVTDIFVSEGGRLPAKYVFHAVGPKWKQYLSHEKDNCYVDLRRTVLRCLLEAARRELTSIALPSISAALFEVPKHVCAENYMKATKHFCYIFPEICPKLYKEHLIQFVDVDNEMTDLIVKCFEKLWHKKPISLELAHDKEFAGNFLTEQRLKELGSSQKAYQATSSTDQKGNAIVKLNPSTKDLMAMEYRIGHINVSIKAAHATDVKADLIVVIGEVFKDLSSHSRFSENTDITKASYRTKDNLTELLHIKQPGKQSGRLLCRLGQDFYQMSSPTRNSTFLDALRSAELEAQSDLDCAVITSRCMYRAGRTHKLIGRLSQSIFDFVDQVLNTTDHKLSLSKIIICTSSEFEPTIIKVFDSRAKDHSYVKKVPATGSEASTRYPRQEKPSYPHTQQGSEASTRYQQQEKLSYPHPEQGSEASTRYQQQEKLSYPHPEQGEHRECNICLLNGILVTLSCCQFCMCQVCIDKIQRCPNCQMIFGVLRGDQPRGQMSLLTSRIGVAGYERAGSLEITYTFLGGLQESDNPNPGIQYKGTTRKAYLPDTEQGKFAIARLRLAFIRRLIFTIGISNKTGVENAIVWNDIHHKTSKSDGSYGYPDATYFSRLERELDQKGVFLESMTPEEKLDVKEFCLILRLRYLRDK